MADFQPESIFQALADHGVRYVLIGGLAATLHGSNLRTGDVDICPAREPENLEFLAASLKQMGARIQATETPDGVRFACDARFLGGVQVCNLVTKYGDLDISFQPAGTEGFEDLARGAVTYRLGKLDVPTSSLDDIIRSKEAANRPKDLQALPTLRTLRLETERGRAKRPSRP